MNCDHEDCSCRSEVGIERDGGRYCSEACAQHETEGGLCRCGHAGCAGTRELRPEAR